MFDDVHVEPRVFLGPTSGLAFDVAIENLSAALGAEHDFVDHVATYRFCCRQVKNTRTSFGYS